MAVIVVVDDEAKIRHLVRAYLEREGHTVIEAATAAAAVEVAGAADLMILDLGLPDRSGQDVAREVRRSTDVPIIMLTARDSELDKIVGLEIGADDYLPKPFSVRELVARVRAALRRAVRIPQVRSEDVHESDGLRVDLGRRQVLCEGAEISLKPKEFELLAFLMADPGQVFARERILAGVWGFDYSGDSRTVDTHVKTLREKLGDHAVRSRWIETVRGAGYRFREVRAL